MAFIRGSNLTFTALGVMFILFGTVVRVIRGGAGSLLDILPEILSSVGVTVLAVSVISAVWNQLGNDPIQRSIDNLTNLVELFGDSRRTGVVRIYQNRSEYERERLESLRRRMTEARCIELSGRVLLRDWAASPPALEAIQSAISAGCTVRIVLLDPDGEAAQRRARQESLELEYHTLESGEAGKLIQDIRKTLRRLARLHSGLDPSAKIRFQVRTLKDIDPYAQIVRVDDYMWMQPYLYHASGGESASLEVEGPKGSIFRKYTSEFDSLWDRGTATFETEA